MNKLSNYLQKRRIASRRMNETLSDKIFNVVNFFFATIILVAVLYPIIYVVSSSFSDPLAVITGQVRFLPVGFTLEGYRSVFRHSQVITGYLNSLWYMGVGVSISIFLTILAAYPFSRKDFTDRGKLMAIFAFTMFFGGGMIPTFLLVRNLGLIDTRWAMVIPGGASVFNIIVMRTFFQNTIPDELLESAKMDGCPDFTFVLKVVIPLSGPIIAVQALFYGLGQWNGFFSALLYLRSSELFPLQLVLRNILIMGDMGEGIIDLAVDAQREWLVALMRYSLIVVSSLPFMLFYPFVQKFFVKGMLVGAIKG